MRISLVVPCYNEQEGIPQLAEALAEVRRTLAPVHELELVFVNDGSTDATLTVLRRCFGGLPNACIVSHGRNRGLGAALRTGFGQATGEWIATIDSDCTYDPRKLPEMIRLMELGADVVIGSPYHPEGEVRNVPRYRLFLSHNLSRLYDVVLGSRIYTYTSLFRLYRGELVRSVTFESNGFLSMAQLLVGVLTRGAKVVEYPTVLSLRQYGESKAAIARLTWQHVRFLARLLRQRLRPGRDSSLRGFAEVAGGASLEARGVTPFRRLAAHVDLVRWNQELNRTHGMSVLAEHPSALVRWHERDRKRRVLRMVRPGHGDLVIEVGCERGGIAFRVAGSCRYLVCVDIDARMLTEARAQLAGRSVGFVVADAQALPLKNRCADVSVSAHTLEHLPDPLAGLRELARITRVSGSLVINVPNDRWVLVLKRLVFRLLGGGARFGGIDRGLAPGHLWIFHRGLLRRLADGVVTLGWISFNAPFFTNMFVMARPLASKAERSAK